MKSVTKTAFGELSDPNFYRLVYNQQIFMVIPYFNVCSLQDI